MASWEVTLTRHKTSKSVLYMEFVDLLFSFLTFSTGRVLKLVANLGEDKKGPGTAISNIFDSMVNLPGKAFLDEEAAMQFLDQPICADLPGCVGRLITGNRPIGDQCIQAKTFYHCNDHCRKVFSEGYMDPATCNVCNGKTFKRNRCTIYHSFENGGQGFVKGNGTYMITNSLRITQASTANITLLLAQLKVQSLGDVETCQVRVGSKQALQLLQASIGAISETLLTDIFPPEQEQ